MQDPFTGEKVLDQETGKPVEDPSTIEQWSEKLRASVGELTRPMPAGTVKTPDDIIRDLDELDRIASQVVAVTREADKTRRAAKRMLTKARLRARGGADAKDAEARGEQVSVASMAEWEIFDNSEVAYEYARSVARLVENRASHVQTQSKQVEVTYHLAGRGQ